MRELDFTDDCDSVRTVVGRTGGVLSGTRAAAAVALAVPGRGRVGIAGGFERSVYPTAGTVPSPIQPGVALTLLRGLGKGGDLVFFRLDESLSLSFLLSRSASSRSTRSRH